MGLITEEVVQKWNSRNKNWYISKGYPFSRIKDEFLIKVKDLTNGSKIFVDCECDSCGKKLKNITWKDYKKQVKEDGKYYCRGCAHNLFGKRKELKTKLKNGTSFAEYCIKNIDKHFLEKYWNYEKNKINPWEITYTCSKPKVWIKCQLKDYHESYNVSCGNFIISNSRCPYCSNRHGNVHPLDSLGALLEEKELLDIWSDKNKKSPYEYAPMSNQYAWWKCYEGRHDDYKRKINDSNTYNFRCPKCQFSKGEEKISQYLINNNINYESQKTFEGLIGTGNGLLSYDFFLPQYNLLIEYQGQQHEKYIPGFHKSEKDFMNQLEHDKRKYNYAKNNNIKLLEIWYYNFGNVETILEKELVKLYKTPATDVAQTQ